MGPSVPQGHSGDWLVSWLPYASICLEVDNFARYAMEVVVRYDTRNMNKVGVWAAYLTSYCCGLRPRSLLSCLARAYRLCLVVSTRTCSQYHTRTATLTPDVLLKKIDETSRLLIIPRYLPGTRYLW